MNAPLEELKAAAMKCTRCGACQPVCPVHRQLRAESGCARGKLFLLRSYAEGSVAVTNELAHLAATCTLCKACESVCPSGIKTQRLIMALRKEMAVQKKLPLVKKWAFAFLTYTRLFDWGMRLGKPFHRLIFKKAPGGVGKLTRVPIPAAGLNMRRIIPDLSAKPLSSIVPRVNSVPAPRARVIFFPGCMLNYVYSDAGKAVIVVLNANNVEVIVPKGLACCGTPAFSSGDFAHAATLAEANVKILSEQPCDAIITACATCGSALKHEYDLVLGDGAMKDRWRNLSNKVFDVAEYLQKIGMVPPTHSVRLRATYHDPCHLARGMGVRNQPRELLKSIPGFDFREMQESDACCGCAGTFSATHYELSRNINDKKLDNALNTNASLLVTGCSACRMHIEDGLSRRNTPMKVLHTAQVLAKAYGK